MYIARSEACCKDISIKNMEEKASKSHAKPGSKHDLQIQGTKQGKDSLSLFH